MPIVTVVMPCYNHERFVSEAISSILHQTVSDIELIVVDDGSSDNSNRHIESIADPRVKHIPLARNVGASEATNIGIRASRGRYIAICNSDDVWVQTKLEKQVSVLGSCSEISAVFSDVSWINDEGQTLEVSQLPWYHNVFRRATPSRSELLRLLVEEGNFLCHPSLLIRREVYGKIGLYNNSLRQLPDLDMWVRFAQTHSLLIMPDKLVQFRIHNNNTSGDGSGKQARTWAEHELICRAFFRTVPDTVFYESFGASSARASVSSDQTVYKKEVTNYLLSYDGPFKKIFRQIALEMCHEFARNGDKELILASQVHALSMEVGLAALCIAGERTDHEPLKKTSWLSALRQLLLSR